MSVFRRPRARRWIMAVAPASFLLAGCGDAPPAVEPVVRPVRTVTVRATNARQVRTFSGVARPGAESTLSFRVAGVIASVGVEVGDRVPAGAVVAALDPVDYEIGVQEAEAGLRQAQAQAENARALLRRTMNLYENDNASPTDLDAATAQAASSAALVDAAERRLDRARRQSASTLLAAPAAGAVAAVLAEVGENASPGQGVVELVSEASPEVAFAAPEAFIRQIRDGSPASVVFDAIPGESFSGTVTEVGVAPGSAATTFPVIVRLGPDAAEIRSGMAAEVTIEFGGPEASGRIVAPLRAVGEDRQGRFVFVAEPVDQGFAVARRRAVSLGELTDDGVEVLDGLADGDLLVVAGFDRLHEGQRVRLEAGGAADPG